MIAPRSDAPEDDYDVLQRFFSRGGSVRMLTDISKQDLDTLYAHGNQLFDAGEWQAAHNIYLVLARVDHWNFDYWLALGLTCQRIGSHDEAVFCFSRSGTIVIDDPRPSFFAGLSYRALGNDEYATKAFNAALRWCGQRAEYRELRDSAVEQLACCKLKEN